MPKGFTQEGLPILTKEEFMKAILEPRGYIKDGNGNWFLPGSPKVVRNVSKKTTEMKTKIGNSSSQTLNKEIILEELKRVLKNYTPTVDKSSLTLVYNDDRYEFKITKKQTGFNFIEQDIKDIGKKRLTNEILKTSICKTGMIEGSGAIGFTNGEQYFSVSIVKKRK